MRSPLIQRWMGGGRMLRTEVAHTATATPVDSQGTAVVGARELSVRYRSKTGTVDVLNRVTLSVQAGEFISIIGPSGCGKSTILHALAGLLPASATTAGTMWRDEGGGLGYLFQRETLLPWRRVLDNIAIPLELRGVPRAERLERARILMARYGLSGFEDHYPGQLSGGMRQRVLLMRTLIYAPRTVFLDEPLGSLDAQTRLTLQEEVKERWRESGSTFVLVTHDLDEAIALSTRILLIGGRPGHICAEYPVALPRTESIIEARSQPEFLALERQLWAHLREEAQRQHANAR